jgi:hypothetical protein
MLGPDRPDRRHRNRDAERRQHGERHRHHAGGDLPRRVRWVIRSCGEALAAGFSSDRTWPVSEGQGRRMSLDDMLK